MAYPISSTRRTDRPAVRAFTLIEVMVGAAIGAFVLTGVLSTFVVIGKNGANAANYTQLEAQARQGLETFSREARLANSVGSYSSTSVTLGIPDTTSGSVSTVAYYVTYAYNSTSQTFTRTGPPLNNPSGASGTTTLISGVQNLTLNYYRYVTGGGYADGFTSNTASNATEIKQIELTLTAKLTSVTVAAATDQVLSARFILRNK